MTIEVSIVTIICVGIFICFLLMALAWAAGYERGKADHGVECLASKSVGNCVDCGVPTFNPSMTWDGGKPVFFPAPKRCKGCE